MQELNSLDDVLELCESVTEDSSDSTINHAIQTLIELGSFTREPLTQVVTLLYGKLPQRRFNSSIFLTIVDLGLSEVETREIYLAIKASTGISVTALRSDFRTFQQANDLVAEQEPSTATQLVAMALESGMRLWHDDEKNPYATLKIDDHLEHHKLKTKAVKRYLAHLYYQQYSKTPNSQGLQDALTVLEAKAVFDGKEYKPHTRLAEVDGVIYLDLANPSWQVVRISAKGWAIVEADDVPIRFRRPRGMQALTAPTEGGSLDELAALVNVEKGSRDWKLIVAWLLQALRGVGSYPVLVLTGEQGSGKSTVAKLLRAMLDPNVTPLRSLSRDERDLFIAAVNGWALAFDNISGLSQWTSDTLCKLSTGGGLSTRELFSDDEETLLDAQRPVVLNGITDFVDKQDLVSRALQVRLLTIPKTERKLEAKMWEDFDKAKPGILGSLLDVVVKGLNELPHTTLDELPRLADFALWATACERGLGWQPGSFLKAYGAAQDDLIRDALEAEPVAVALMKLPEQGDGLAVEWTFTPSDLLDKLNDIQGYVKDGGKRAPKGWPQAANSLTQTLKRITPALAEQGIILTPKRDGTTKNSRIWVIRLNRADDRPNRPNDDKQAENTVQDGHNASDDTSDDTRASDDRTVRTREDRPNGKHRTGRKSDTSDDSDGPERFTSAPGEKNKEWEGL